MKFKTSLVFDVIDHTSATVFAQTANCVDNGSGYSCSGSNMPSGGGGGNMGAFMPPTNSGYGGSSTMSPEAFAAKQKAEAYGKCMNDMYTAKSTCQTAVNNNLLSNQATCTKVGESMIGVTAGVGILIALTGVGAVPGASIVTAAGATGGMIYNQCNNMAQNIAINGKEACELDFNKTKLKCDAIKP